jgi:hypothetical protein
MCLPEPIDPFMPLSLKLCLAELRKDKIFTIANNNNRTFCLFLKVFNKLSTMLEKSGKKGFLVSVEQKRIMFGLGKKSAKKIMMNNESCSMS